MVDGRLIQLTVCSIRNKSLWHFFAGPVEYCNDEAFEARCQENEVIQIKSARYGRFKVGKCVQTDMGECLIIIL